MKIVEIPLGRTTKVFVLEDEGGAVLVDAGLPEQAGRILIEAAARRVDLKRVRLILITHGHLDHFGSAAALRKQLDVPVAVHEGDVEFLRAGSNPREGMQPTSATIRFLMRFVHFSPAHPDAALEPDIVFDGGLDLTDFGVAAEAFSTPGHTPGSISIATRDADVIVGDLIMGGILRATRPADPMVAWDLALNRESVRRMLERHPQRIYATHGGPFVPEQVSAWIGRA